MREHLRRGGEDGGQQLGLPEKSGTSSSTPQPGTAAWIARTVSAYSHDPSSGRSSRVTTVTKRWLYAETVRKIHELNPGTGVELLIPDFSGKPEHIAAICASEPEVLRPQRRDGARIFKRIRPAFRYDRSLDVITRAGTSAW